MRLKDRAGSNRRTFLKSATAIGVAAAGSRGRAQTSLARQQGGGSESWDLIVIGGGTAGMPAAIFGSQAGRVLLIERGSVLGGTLDRASGQIAAAGTKIQKVKGIADTPDEHYADIVRINGGTCDLELARAFVHNAAPTVDWLYDSGFRPLDSHPVLGGAHENFTKERYCWGPENGVSLIKAMKPGIDAAVASGRLNVLLETSAIELMVGGSGSIVGVVAEDSAGRRTTHRGRAVLLASGGCGSNPAMFLSLHGVPMYARITHPNALGHGITMGLAVGGYVRGGEKYHNTWGTILQDRNYPSPPSVSPSMSPTARPMWEISVNEWGRRYVREDHPSVDHREKAILAQPGRRHFLVFDQTILDEAPPLFPRWDRAKLDAAFGAHPMFHKAPSVSTLAARLGINAANLDATVREYNDAVAAKTDTQFGRAHLPRKISRAPFYGVEVQAITVMSWAGLGVDASLRVLRPDESPISNLYAAGEVIGAGATLGSAFTNGMGITPALVFGRMLGTRLGKPV
jgi:fumarate reductase flavoprotein subunit